MDHDLCDVTFHGLLHVAPDHARPVNMGRRGDPLMTYVACAVLRARSLAHHGYRFRLITNDPAAVEHRRQAAGLAAIDTVQHRFVSEPPRNAAFFSAQFKTELFAAFGTGEFGEGVALIDIDTVLRRPFRLTVPANASLIAYAISDQLAADHRARVDRDMSMLRTRPSIDTRWWGGEFIVGQASAFAELGDEVRRRWPGYLDHHASFHHSGDETVTTAALTELSQQGRVIADAGRPGGVARWWSSRTLSPQAAFADIADRSLLHLPADKAFLAGQAPRPFDPDAFLRRYRAHVRRKLLARRLVVPVRSMLGHRDGRIMPRLTA